MEVIIEQLGTTNNILDRQKFSQNVIRIGRAYSNDLILTDEHVDKLHAFLSCDNDGRWWLSDNHSLNGIKKPHSRKHIARQQIKSGDVFLLGRNKIRILFGNHPLPPTVKVRFSEVFLLALGHLPVLFTLVVGYFALKGLTVYHTATGEIKWSAILGSNLQVALSYIGLALFVYLLSVLFRRGGNFLSHIGLLILVFFASEALALAVHIVKFNTASGADSMIAIWEQTNGYVVLWLYFWSILYLAFHLSLKRRTLASLGLIVLFVSINLLNQDAMKEFTTPTVDSDRSLLPPIFLWREPTAAGDYLAASGDLYRRVEEDRQKALAERDKPDGKAE